MTSWLLPIHLITSVTPPLVSVMSASASRTQLYAFDVALTLPVKAPVAVSVRYARSCVMLSGGARGLDEGPFRLIASSAVALKITLPLSLHGALPICNCDPLFDGSGALLSRSLDRRQPGRWKRRARNDQR